MGELEAFLQGASAGIGATGVTRLIDFLGRWRVKIVEAGATEDPAELAKRCASDPEALKELAALIRRTGIETDPEFVKLREEIGGAGAERAHNTMQIKAESIGGVFQNIDTLHLTQTVGRKG